MHRKKFTKVKTAKGRKTSSTKWLQRQLNDPYITQAKKDGYISRAAYKLLEIDSKFHILGRGKVIIDLGAAPGSWIQVALKTNPKQIIAVDLLPLKQDKNVEFILGDFTHENTLKKILAILNDKSNKPDIILSDMAPNASGHRDLDHLQIIALGEDVFEFAKNVLKKDGSLIIKTFQGGQEKDLADKLKTCFAQVKFFKPQASRKNSVEIFLVATKFIESN
ncbi:MAG: RlmE family RNA methyltransferase [Rickettsiales bacterium]|nr:RlmE family RNA methyltransferase [Rickettsiales bacterium]